MQKSKKKERNLRQRGSRENRLISKRETKEKRDNREREREREREKERGVGE